MKAEQFIHDGFFLLRTPSLPRAVARSVQELSDTVHVVQPTAVSAAREGTAWSTIAFSVSEALNRSEVRAAIHAASPSLFEELWGESKVHRESKKQDALAAASSYVVRMSTRAKPFGLFAGVSMGAVANETDLRTGSIADARATLRIEAPTCQRLISIARDILADLGRLIVARNPTLVQRGPDLHFYGENESGTTRRTIQRSRIVELMLREAREEISIGDLEDKLAARCSLAMRGRVRPVLQEALKSNLLCIVSRSTLDDEALLRELVSQLKDSEPASPYSEVFSQVVRSVDACKAVPVADCMRSAEELESRIALLVPLDHDETRRPAVYWDLQRGGEPTISSQLVSEIATSAELLATVTTHPRNARFEEFERRFLARYESRSVPLLDALDEFSGIVTLSEHDFGRYGANARLDTTRAIDSDEVRRTQMLATLLDRWHAIGTPSEAVVERSFGSAEVPTESLRLGSSFAVHATIFPIIVASNAVRALHVRSVITGNGCRTLGRFSGLDAKLCHAIQKHLDAAALDVAGSVHAEVCWLNSSRGANVLRRSFETSHVISVGPVSVSRRAGAIQLDDLYLQYRAGRLVLFSESLGAEVIPRLTSAFNFRLRCHPVFQFLSELSTASSVQSFSWHWGLMSRLARLPRVRCGNAIFAPGSWGLSDAQQLLLASAGRTERSSIVAKLRDELSLPEQVTVQEGEDELSIDLGEAECHDILARRARLPLPMRLCEDLSSALGALAYASDGNYAHELVIPFRTHTRGVTSLRSRQHAVAVLGRGHERRPLSAHSAFGGEWAFFRTYCNPSATHAVLRRVRASFAQFALLAETELLWFFVRYSEPEYHLRIRVKCSPRALWETVAVGIQDCIEALVSDKVLIRYDLASYEPEFSRYGGERGVALAERVFHLDSEFVVDMFGRSGIADGDPSDAMMMIGLDALLSAMVPAATDRILLLQSWSTSLTGVASTNDWFEPDLRRRLRLARPELDQFLSITDAAHSAIIPPETTQVSFQQAVANRFEHLTIALAGLRSTLGRDASNVAVNEFAMSVGHMYMNRVSGRASAGAEREVVRLLQRALMAREARAGRPLAWSNVEPAT